MHKYASDPEPDQNGASVWRDVRRGEGKGRRFGGMVVWWDSGMVVGWFGGLVDWRTWRGVEDGEMVIMVSYRRSEPGIEVFYGSMLGGWDGMFGIRYCISGRLPV